MQSSTDNDYFGSHLAVDNDDTTCSYTGYQDYPWLQLDLQGVYDIKSITVKPNVDCVDCCKYYDINQKVNIGCFHVTSTDSAGGTINELRCRSLCKQAMSSGSIMEPLMEHSFLQNVHAVNRTHHKPTVE